MNSTAMPPLVSIVTSSYNQGHFIEQTILSVLNQTYSNIEYIIVDSCSTDSTPSILEEYTDLIDKIIIEKDSGSADGLNKAFLHASGDYLCFLNSDDLLKPYAIATLVDSIIRHETDLVYGDVEFIDSRNQRIYPYFYPLAYAVKLTPFDLFARTAVIPQQGSMWSRRLHDYGLRFNASNKTCWDYEFFAEALSTGFTSTSVPILVASFRIHSQSITGESLSINSCENSRLAAQRAIDRKRVIRLLATRGFSTNTFSRLLLKSINLVRRTLRFFSSYTNSF